MFSLTGCAGKDKDVYINKGTIDSVELLEAASDGSGICMVYWKENEQMVPDLLSDRYLVERESKWTSPREICLSYTITVHDLKEETQYTLTMEDFQKLLPKDRRFMGNMGYFGEDGQWYYTLDTRRKKDMESIIGELSQLLDVESGIIEPELYEYEVLRDRSLQAADEEDNEYWNSLYIFWIEEFIWANGFQNNGVYQEEREAGEYLKVWSKHEGSTDVGSGEVEIELAGEGLPEHNEALYTKFPGLEQYRGEEYIILIHLTDKPGAEEILHLLMEDGEEISFEGVTVPKEYSLDGQEHKVESFEDWDKWYTGMLRE